MSTDYAEGVQATVARMFKRQNKVVELEILLRAEASIEYYNQDWGVDYCTLHLSLPFDVFEQVLDERQTIEKSIADEINKFASARKESFNVSLVPKIEVPPNWRENINSISQSAFGIPSIDSQYSTDIFVIMPFKGNNLDHVYRDHVTKVATDLGMSIRRGDDFFSKTSVIQDIWA
ncbi:MAG: hypothetical protein J0M07_28580, partial [Anaerolineae bacterium]|nr:hypothetical protein [Anaerolineae bacterium]